MIYLSSHAKKDDTTATSVAIKEESVEEAEPENIPPPEIVDRNVIPKMAENQQEGPVNPDEVIIPDAAPGRRGEITDNTDPNKEPGEYNPDPEAPANLPSGATGGTAIGVGKIGHYGTGKPSAFVSRRAGGGGRGGGGLGQGGGGGAGGSTKQTETAVMWALQPDSNIQQASLGAPAADVARSMCSAKLVLKMSEFAESSGNVTIVVGDTEISHENVAEVRKDMQRRIAACESAARQRGTANVAGSYRATAENCGSSGSFLAAVITEGLKDVSVTQDGPSVRLSFRGKPRGKKYKIDADVCLIESSLAMTDPVESGFSYIGEARDARLLFRPDVEAILSGMFPPADRTALESCLVTLEPATKP